MAQANINKTLLSSIARDQHCWTCVKYIVKRAHAVTSIKQSPFTYPVTENFI
jgi:hypothetical protein